jgi:hypothetical protein
VPPLRERREDIPLLVSAFIKEFSKEYDRPISGISLQAMDHLKTADWDGNVRELRNTIATAIILAETETFELSNVEAVEIGSNPSIISKSVEDFFQQNVLIACHLLGTTLRLDQVKRWIEEDIVDEAESYRRLIDQAHTEIKIGAFPQLDRKNKIQRLEEIVESGIAGISKLLDLEDFQTISIRGRTLDQCILDIYAIYKHEYGGDLVKVAKALGLSVDDLQEDIHRRRERRKDHDPPAECKLKPFPAKELNVFAEANIYEFLGYPTSRYRIAALDWEEKLRSLRIALCIFRDRLIKNDHGTICFGGMTLNEIEHGIYERTLYLYRDPRSIAKALGKDAKTVRRKITREFPSKHTLF